jgi:tetratricopeptide (TPR) repeat protein
MEALEVVLEYSTGHPDQESLLSWAEQLANSQEAWPTVADYLHERAPFPRNAAAVNRFYGEALLRVGRMDAAANALELALEARPHDLRIRKDLALAYRGMGRLSDAATLFGELASESPEHPLLQQLLAETLADQGDIEGALLGYEAALRGLVGREEVSPSHRDAIRQRIALLHLARDQYEDVRVSLEDLEIPGGVLALELWCRLAIATENWGEARKLAGKLSDIDRDRSGLVRMLEGTIAVGEKKWSKAAGKFDEAIERLGPYARGNVAEVYRAAERPEIGLDLLKAWVADDPELPDARFHLGVFYYEIDRWEDAERELSEAVRLDPRHARALNFLGYSWVERDSRLEEALTLIERALEVEAWNGAYLDSLGWVYHQMGRFEEALEPLERAARELPKDATVLEHLGDVYGSLGQRARAVVAWNRALEAGAQDRDTILRKIRQAGATDQIAAEDAREQDDVPQR